MISIIVAVKDCRDLAAACLDSLAHSVRVLGLQPQTEFILIDDQSRPDSDIVGVFRAFRGHTTSPVRAMRFRTHQHYTCAVALGLSLARGDAALFFSHDMIVAPPALAALLAHADRNPHIGIIRPVSQHMDMAVPMQIEPPLPPRTPGDVASFARCVAQCCANELAPQVTLIGDAMLVTRRCLDAVGVFDTRFVGFMGDLDFGLRARHAGFYTVIARDAWVHHWGQAVGKEVVQRAQAGGSQPDPELGLPLIHRAYEKFRQKWDPALPSEFNQLKAPDLDRLAAMPRASLRFSLHEPPISADVALCEEI